jgi:hypothetical protein
MNPNNNIPMSINAIHPSATRLIPHQQQMTHTVLFGGNGPLRLQLQGMGRPPPPLSDGFGAAADSPATAHLPPQQFIVNNNDNNYPSEGLSKSKTQQTPPIAASQQTATTQHTEDQQQQQQKPLDKPLEIDCWNTVKLYTMQFNS